MGYQGFDHHHGTENDLSPFEHLSKRLKALDLNSDDNQWFLGGSSALALRDIRRVNDIDVGVTTGYWHYLHQSRGYKVWVPHENDAASRCDPAYLTTEVLGTEVHIFNGWRWRSADETKYNSFNEVFRDGMEWVRGWPVIKLNVLLQQKVDAIQWEEAVRPKDLRDIIAIAQHMQAKGEAA